MKRRTWLLASALAIAIAATGLALFALRPAPLEVTLAVPLRVRSTPIYVALDRGFFRDEGIKPKLMVPETGKDGLAAVLDGEADFALTSGMPVVVALRAGHPPSILAAVSSGDLHLALVSAPGSDIDTFFDLAGKRVAVTAGTASHAYLAALLRGYGLSPAEVTIVDATPAQALEGMRNGEVDAVITWDHWIRHIATALGHGARILRDKDAYFDYWLLVGPSRSGAPTESESRVMRALVRADTYIQSNPQDTIRIMTAYTGGNHDEWLSTYFDLQLDGSVVRSLQATARLTAHNEALPDLANVLRPGPLAAAVRHAREVGR